MFATRDPVRSVEPGDGGGCRCPVRRARGPDRCCRRPVAPIAPGDSIGRRASRIRPRTGGGDARPHGGGGRPGGPGLPGEHPGAGESERAPGHRGAQRVRGRGFPPTASPSWGASWTRRPSSAWPARTRGPPASTGGTRRGTSREVERRRSPERVPPGSRTPRPGSARERGARAAGGPRTGSPLGGSGSGVAGGVGRTRGAGAVHGVPAREQGTGGRVGGGWEGATMMHPRSPGWCGGSGAGVVWRRPAPSCPASVQWIRRRRLSSRVAAGSAALQAVKSAGVRRGADWCRIHVTPWGSADRCRIHVTPWGSAGPRGSRGPRRADRRGSREGIRAALAARSPSSAPHKNRTNLPLLSTRRSTA
jgi:hypothetical protein